jgi:hypothetical protein
MFTNKAARLLSMFSYLLRSDFAAQTQEEGFVTRPPLLTIVRE